MFDLLIKNGTVVDGSGAPGYLADIGITRDSITVVGSFDGDAAQTIDATGRVITPGFIDLHCHSDMSFLIDPLADSKLTQGVTLELNGNCGMSPCAPLQSKMALEALENRFFTAGAEFTPDWTDFAGYLEAQERAKGVINQAFQVGHGTVRTNVLGMDARAPSLDELEHMKRLVAESIEAGAMGFATGLFYAPGSYSLTDEVVELAQEAASRGALYSSHIRSESNDSVGLHVAVNEAIEVGRRTGGRIQMSHVKVKGPLTWGRAEEILELQARARREGIDVAGDQYPYTASSTSLTGGIFPRWALAGGRTATLEIMEDSDLRARLRDGIDWNIKSFMGSPDSVLMAAYGPDRDREGQRLDEIADDMGCDPAEAAIRLYEHGDAAIVQFSLREDDVDLIARDPYIAVASDGNSVRSEGPLSAGKPHPRSYGTFPRFLSEMRRDKNLVSLEEAVRKMCALPASRLQLTRRGRVAPGCFADLVVFDPDTIQDTATFTEPHQYTTGIDTVVVNGQVALENGAPTGVRAGRVVRATNG
jgi:N-acyl-D-amino-acid deacylase|tara:strand:- start:1269 stop:2867 length:1599 start_codon:yes stop_codon:yes gene_type:complete